MELQRQKRRNQEDDRLDRALLERGKWTSGSTRILTRVELAELAEELGWSKGRVQSSFERIAERRRRVIQKVQGRKQ